MPNSVSELVEWVLPIERSLSILYDWALFHLRAISSSHVDLIGRSFSKLHLLYGFLHLLMSFFDIVLALNLARWIWFIQWSLKLRQKCVQLFIVGLLRLLELRGMVAHVVELVDFYVLCLFSFVAFTFAHTAKLTSALLFIQIFLVFVCLFWVDAILKISLINHNLIFVCVFSFLGTVRVSWMRVSAWILFVEVPSLDLWAICGI